MHGSSISLCVFLASRPGTEPAWGEFTRRFALALADRGYRLMYGGASVGLMGILADTALEAGVEVHGVIPQCLVDLEVAHPHLTQLSIVDSMHERKRQMADWSDAFVLLPGGVGSLEEIFEIITWRQLGIHQKPVAVLNVAGFYDQLLSFLETCVEKDFVGQPLLDSIIVETEVDALFERIDSECLRAPLN